MSTVNDHNEANSNSSPFEKAIILDLGKKKRKDIKRLRKGRGKLLARVEEYLEELRAAGGISDAAQPVIIVVSEKRPKVRWL